MLLSWAFVVALLGLGVGEGALPPPARSYNILMLLPVSSKSHRNVFMPIAEAMGDRGHKVVMLTNHPPSSKNPNVKEVTHGLPDFDNDNMNMFELMKKPNVFSIFSDVLPKMAREIYHTPVVKDLYSRRKEFDLIIVNHMFNEIVYPFLHEMPFITLATPGLDPSASAVMGNVLHPSYVPSITGEFQQPFSMIERAKNIFGSIFLPVYWRYWGVVPPVQAEITAQFPELPSLLQIEKNLSLTLINSHFSWTKPLPLLPSQIEVGGMHCRPGKPLPADLQKWIDGAGTAGVVYFSLGSVTKGSTMPKEYRDAFLAAFAKLPQRVIWKFEETLQNVPKNVMISKWLPQQDILAHPNVKVFITHCGLLSIQEAAYHATAILGTPLFGDQPKNCHRSKNNGVGDVITWDELTEERVIAVITDLATNPKYTKNLQEISAVVRDQINSPIDRAVWWTEYVIRHRGAPYLHSPAQDITWISFFNLDLILLFHFALYLGYRLINKVCCFFCKKQTPKSKRKRE